MRDILDPQYAHELQRYLRPNTLIAFDYDGTLAPIVADRQHAIMRETTRELLYQVASKYQTVVISGRARDDLLGFVGDLPIADAVGNHGCETVGLDASSAIATVNSWMDELAASLSGIEGIDIENKRLTLAVHYRNAPRDAAEKIQGEIQQLRGARLIGGKMVFNVVPSGLPNKGDALMRLCRLHRTEQYVFVGDDDTDEDIFVLRGGMPGIGIRVGHSDASFAQHYIEDQVEIESLLGAMLAGTHPGLAT